MICGNKQLFAIECNIAESSRGWVFGRFRFWLGGIAVGNWEDSVDLKGCAAWLRHFSRQQPIRREPKLFEIPSDALFRKIWDPVFALSEETNEDPSQLQARFHVSYIGMTAFDRVDMVVVGDDTGRERCVWRTVEDPVLREIVIEAGGMERVAEDFCTWFERETESVGPKEGL